MIEKQIIFLTLLLSMLMNQHTYAMDVTDRIALFFSDNYLNFGIENNRKVTDF